MKKELMKECLEAAKNLQEEVFSEAADMVGTVIGHVAVALFRDECISEERERDIQICNERQARAVYDKGIKSVPGSSYESELERLVRAGAETDNKDSVNGVSGKVMSHIITMLHEARGIGASIVIETVRGETFSGIISDIKDSADGNGLCVWLERGADGSVVYVSGIESVLYKAEDKDGESIIGHYCIQCGAELFPVSEGSPSIVDADRYRQAVCSKCGYAVRQTEGDDVYILDIPFPRISVRIRPLELEEDWIELFQKLGLERVAWPAFLYEEHAYLTFTNPDLITTAFIPDSNTDDE